MITTKQSTLPYTYHLVGAPMHPSQKPVIDWYLNHKDHFEKSLNTPIRWADTNPTEQCRTLTKLVPDIKEFIHQEADFIYDSDFTFNMEEITSDYFQDVDGEKYIISNNLILRAMEALCHQDKKPKIALKPGGFIELYKKDIRFKTENQLNEEQPRIKLEGETKTFIMPESQGSYRIVAYQHIQLKDRKENYWEVEKPFIGFSQKEPDHFDQWIQQTALCNTAFLTLWEKNPTEAHKLFTRAIYDLYTAKDDCDDALYDDEAFEVEASWVTLAYFKGKTHFQKELLDAGQKDIKRFIRSFITNMKPEIGNLIPYTNENLSIKRFHMDKSGISFFVTIQNPTNSIKVEFIQDEWHIRERTR
jgi:hypothetical protein